MGFLIALLFIPVIIFLIFYPVYLGLISHKDLILKKLASVDAYLISRHTTVEKFIDSVENIMQKEASTIQNIRKLLIKLNKLKMKWNNNEERFNLENQLDVELDIFFTASVRYKEITGNIYINKTLKEFIATQTLLIKAVKEYNQTLRNYKMLISSPPGTILVPILKIKCSFVEYYVPEK